MTPIAVLISGNGTTLQNLIDVTNAGLLPVEIVQVISNRECFGVERAKIAGIPIKITRQNSEVFDQCREAKLVCLAGYLQLLQIPDDFTNRVINIHPSLLPKFGGKGMYGHFVHQAVLNAGEKKSGCTVHFVDNEFDHGEIILQRSVPVLENDVVGTLAARVFEQECIAYPEAIRFFLKENENVSIE